MKHIDKACIFLLCIISTHALSMHIITQFHKKKVLNICFNAIHNTLASDSWHYQENIMKIIELRKDNHISKQQLEILRVNGEELNRSDEYSFHLESIEINERKIRTYLDKICKSQNFSFLD